MMIPVFCHLFCLYTTCQLIYSRKPFTAYMCFTTSICWQAGTGTWRGQHRQTTWRGTGGKNNITKPSFRNWQTGSSRSEILVRDRRLGWSSGKALESGTAKVDTGKSVVDLVSLCWAGCGWVESRWACLAGQVGQDQWKNTQDWMTEPWHREVLRIFRWTTYQQN